MEEGSRITYITTLQGALALEVHFSSCIPIVDCRELTIVLSQM